MKRMKQAAAAVLAALMLSGSAAAYRVPNTHASFELNVSTEGVNGDYMKQADMLHTLGLLQGKSEDNYAFYDPMTRAEAATLLARFLGGGQTAEDGNFQTPFADVSGWAAPYIGWLYHQGLTKGVSATKYDPDARVTAEQFSLFLSRAVCGGDSLAATALTKDEREWIDGYTSDDGQFWSGNGFVRMTAMGMMTRALTLQDAAGHTLAQNLIEKGVFTAAAFGKAAWGILPPVYGYDEAGHVTCVLAGVQIAATDGTGLRFDSNTAAANLDHLLAYRQNGDKVAVFRLDPHTLAATQTGEVALDGGTLREDAYIGTLGTRDYFYAPDGALYCFDGANLTETLDKKTMQGAQVKLLTEDRGAGETGVRLTVAATAGLMAYTADAEKPVHIAQTGDIVYQNELCVVLLEKGETGSALACIDFASGKTTESYPVSSGAAFTVTAYGVWIYGEDGFFSVDLEYGERDGNQIVAYHLNKSTSLPVLGVQTVRWGARPSDPFILTHDEGSSVASKVILLSEGKETLFTDLAAAQIQDGVFAMPIDSIPNIFGRNGQDAGMFMYGLLGEKKLYVASYTPDAGKLTDAQTGAVMAREQARLDALGFGW